LASFEDHINQAKKNLIFLSEVNSKINSQWDWQVTICFYVAVHLVNTHVASTSNNHYRSHEQVNNVLSPYNSLSISRLPEPIYLAYIKLQNLSRRSRYLCSDRPSEHDNKVFHTSEKYFAKALRELNTIITYFDKHYSLGMSKVNINCPRVKDDNLEYFLFKPVLSPKGESMEC
jgi:hypothetical protein